jgi:protein-disulfide isomerase
VTVIEYASMTCPHCASFHETTYPEMKKKYIDTGKIRFIFREFPLDTLAMAGSMLARCAGKEKFFPLIETLFAQQKEWVTQKPMQPLLAIAKQRVSPGRSTPVWRSKGARRARRGPVAAAQKFQVTSTPTFFVNGKTCVARPRWKS